MENRIQNVIKEKNSLGKRAGIALICAMLALSACEGNRSLYSGKELVSDVPGETESSELVSFHEKWYQKGDLSEETLEWLDWYDQLSEEDQLKISSVPAELIRAEVVKVTETDANNADESANINGTDNTDAASNVNGNGYANAKSDKNGIGNPDTTETKEPTTDTGNTANRTDVPQNTTGESAVTDNRTDNTNQLDPAAKPETDSTAELPQNIRVENPSWEYYISDPIQSETQPFQLTILEQSTNDITDTDKWFDRNELELKDDFSDGYECHFSPDGITLDLLKDGIHVAALDFFEYQYSWDYVEADFDFIDQKLVHAIVEDGVLYVSTFHNTYSASAPSNAYITAIDLKDYHVLWKSDPLVCNSRNFQIVGDVIFTGHGFTEEPDYLYQLDKKTGTVLAKEKLKTQAEYLIWQHEKLYVRTYNTDYIFDVD